MSLAALAPFMGSISDNRLLEAEQMRELLGPLQKQFPESRALARELIRRGWLTPYQVNQIAAGRGSALSLDQFVILERLGEGGMGQVFKARQRSLGRIVAVKLIRPEQTANTTAVRRFRREAEVAAHLDHPNIVHVLDAGEANGTCYLAMEYVEGRDLGQILSSSGAVPVPLACEYVRQAALGLQHAHDKSMVHRDVKPSNLLVASGPKPIVKLLDLGLARLRALHQDEASVSSVTQAGVVVGTLDYLAPEQAKNAHGADARADLYSLGCTFYHLLTGQVPFVGGTGVEKLLRHQLDTPTPVEKLCPTVPVKVVALVARLLAKKPEDRPATAAEVAETLMPFCNATAKLPSGPRRVPPRVELEPTLQLDAAMPVVAPAAEETLWVEPVPEEAAARKVQPRRRRWLLPLAAVGGGLLLLLFVAVALRAVADRVKGSPAALTPALEPLTWRALERYLPNDTILVLRMAPRQIPASGVIRERLDRDVRNLLQPGGAVEWSEDILGVNLSRDVERAMIAQVYRDPDRPLILLVGQFDPKRFRIGETGLRVVEGPGVPRYEFRGKPEQPALHLALVRNDLLAVTHDTEVIAEVIGKANGTRTTEFTAPKMAELLMLADDSRPVSVAAVGAALASWGVFQKPEFARDLVKRWGIYGSVSLAEDVEADLVCRPIVEDARPDALLGALEAGRRFVGLSLKLQEGFRQEPGLFRKLVDNAEVKRKDDEVILHSRVTANELVRPRFKKP